MLPTNQKIGFIGGGNMANAVIQGLVAAGEISRGDIFVSDKDALKLAEFAKLGINTTTDNAEVERNCDIVILAVKPQFMDVVLAELDGNSDKLYISIAAGVTLERLSSVLGTNAKIVRTMPNTPLMVGCGITILCPNENVCAKDYAIAEAIFACAGEVVRLDEAQINAAMALSASSPAYMYMMVDAMAQSGEELGLPCDVALKLAAKSMEGSAKMVLQTEIEPEQLKNNVCSPGGTTIEAVKTLENEGFADTLRAAINACVEKGNKLDANLP